jgi:hypothetical protein
MSTSTSIKWLLRTNTSLRHEIRPVGSSSHDVDLLPQDNLAEISVVTTQKTLVDKAGAFIMLDLSRQDSIHPARDTCALPDDNLGGRARTCVKRASA